MEQLYFGGDVYTVDDSLPHAEAVAVKDGKIAAVGSKEKCASVLGADYEAIDLKGRTMLPGFIDTHMHPVVKVYFDMNADLRDVKNVAELQDKLREIARKSPTTAWVVGLNFDEVNLDNPVLPTRHDIDAACPDHHAIIIRHDGHTLIANTKVINAAGVSAKTPNPQGGVIDREPDGFPAGTFRETASGLIFSAMPMPDMPMYLSAAKASFNALASYGLTSLGTVLQTGDEGPAGAQGKFDGLAMLMLNDFIPQNTRSYIIADDPKQLQPLMATALHKDGAEPIRKIGGIKIFADGTFGSCTAYMRAPFSDQPDKRGFLVHSEEEIYRRMVEAHNAGLQIIIHSIGDASCCVLIDLFERLLKEHPRADHRHRIEHASILDTKMISDMARLGIIVSTQPMFIYTEKSWLHKRLGAERAKWVYPFRAIVEGGVKIAGASDAPVESADVLHSIQVCVTRDGFETHQCLTVEQAIRMYTIDAAFAQFEDNVKGSVSVGKRADLIVLSQNPTKVAPDKIKDIRVEQTIVGGKVVYRNEG